MAQAAPAAPQFCLGFFGPSFALLQFLLFKSIYKCLTHLIPHLGSSLPLFPSTKLPVFILNAIKLFPHLKKEKYIVSFQGWGKKRDF